MTRTKVSRTLLIGALLLGACRVGEVGREQPPSGPVSPAQNAAAATELGQARSALDAGDAATAERLADSVLARYPQTPAATDARWVLARAAFALGEYDRAIEAAESYAARTQGAAHDEALALAGRARAARQRANETVRIGVLLPRSAPPYLQQYADLVRQGVDLAVEQYGGDTRVELVEVDDAGDATRDAALTRDLDERGVRAVIGPMLTPGVFQAGDARLDRDLVLVSPTASERPIGLPNVYTLNAGDTRGPIALADYALAAGLTRAGILYPRDPEQQRRAQAFRTAFEAGGGLVVSTVPFDSGTTTFGDLLGRIAAETPDALFLPLSVRQIRLVAPQIDYFGFDRSRVLILGGAAWTDDDVLRLVEPRFLENVVASTPRPRAAGGPARPEFVALYESRYRRSLDNPFPALGYDAAWLLLNSLVPGQNDRTQIAARIARTTQLTAATGQLTVQDGELAREPHLVRIERGALVAPLDPDSLYTRMLAPPIDSLAPTATPTGGPD